MTRVNIIDFIARKLKALVGIVQDTDTATVNIAKGKYVIWKGNPCKASSAISSGGTLSASNLTALTEGVGNDINSNIVNNSVTGSSAVTTTHTIADARLAKLGHLAILTATIDLTANVSAWTSVFNINDVRLQASTYVFADVNNEIKEFYVGADGGVSCTSSLTSGKEIKITIPIAVK